MGPCPLKAYILFGERKRQIQRRELFDMYFFKFSIFNIRKHFNGKKAGLMFCSLLISQATVRAPVSTSVVRLTGLSLGFSKPLRVGSGALGAHGGDPGI